MKNALCIALGGLLLPVACFTPQQIALAPVVNVASSGEGNQIEVAVRVVDERDTLSLGRRSSDEMHGTELTTSQDVALVVRQQVVDGLRKKSFQPVEYSETIDPRLTVEVRLLQYSTSTGLWAGNIRIRGAVKVIAVRSGKSYERMYRKERQEQAIIGPSAETNGQWISGVLGDTLKELFRDEDLFRFLSAR